MGSGNRIVRGVRARGFFGLLVAVAVAAMAVSGYAGAADSDLAVRVEGHPRLYFTADELEALRAGKDEGLRPMMWRNLVESAEWCLERTPRAEWIAPVADDPIYENLYDRFYGMMQDMAVTEHLAFTYALTGEARWGDAAREWVLADVRAWRPDADATPDGGKAYAVCRLLKGAAVAYDLVYDRLSEAERAEVRRMLRETASNYYRDYFMTPAISGPEFHTHHAVVETASFGVVALALLGEVPEADEWLEFAVRKFEEHLLPMGLAEDGAQVEGATFWASTMQYRLFFMDALRRVTGRDLFKSHAQYMNADLALASIAAVKEPGWSEPHQTVILSPPYGQLDYYAPILLELAREYRRPIYRHLAEWDRSLGHIQQTRYITPNRKEQLLFELGGYACVWYDPTVEAGSEGAPLEYDFPSVGEVYARSGWSPGGIVVGLKSGGHFVLHAGGQPVMIANGLTEGDTKISPKVETEAAGTTILRWVDAEGSYVMLTLARPDRVEGRVATGGAAWSFWSLAAPEIEENKMKWRGVEIRVTIGGEPEAKPYTPGHAVGFNKLELIDPLPRNYTEVTIAPDATGIIEFECIILNPAVERD